MRNTSSNPEFAGIDGCPRGWTAVSAGPDGRFFSLTIFPAFEALARRFAQSTLCFIDIPIGLKENGDERGCDRAARRILFRRSSSVFRVPVRPAVYADSYERACSVNEQRTGRKISVQTWGIVPKIREVDEILRSRPPLRGKFREAHPELCFASLNGWKPLMNIKRTPAGMRERLALLDAAARGAKEFFSAGLAACPRSHAAAHDILDAMVLALSAAKGNAGALTSLPAEPEVDEEGLRMEIVVCGKPLANSLARRSGEYALQS